jgi:dTMP kinase
MTTDHPPRTTGRLVAIEGIDGSGKGTQAERLVRALQAAGRSVTLLSFPRYEQTSFGKRIGEFLNGRYGTLSDVSPYLVAPLFAGDRFESKPVLLAALDASDVVVLDRYVASNIAHQAAKLDRPERDELRRWIEHLEFELYGLPRPDRVILLDVPPERAQELIARKRARSYTRKAADLQEADREYLQRVRGVYLDLARDDETWRRVDVMEHERIRTVDAIADDVLAACET